MSRRECIEARSTDMHDFGNVCRLLITCYLDQKSIRFIFQLLDIERNSLKPLEHFIAYMVDAHFEYFLFIEEFGGCSNFQNASLVDDRHTVTNCLDIDQQV